MLRSHDPQSGGARRAAAPRLIPVILLGVLAGCGGGGENRADRDVVAPVELPPDPEAALAEVDRALAENSRNAGARAQRAELLTGLGRHEEAAAEWDAVLAAKAKGKARATALVGSAKAWEMSCGVLRPLAADETQARSRAERALSGWRTCTEEVDPVAGQLGQARCLYRLGRFDESSAIIVRSEGKSAEFSEERCLALLIEEARGGAPLPIVRRLDLFARAPDVAVRELAVGQLVRFAETASDAEVAHTAEGLLVRLCRDESAHCPTLLEWESSRRVGSEHRLAAAHRTRAISQTKDCLDRGRPLQAWRSLELLLRGAEEGDTEVRALVNRCCSQLCELCRAKLEVGDLEAAGQAANVIRGLPAVWLGTSESECAMTMLRAHQVAAIRAQAKETLTSARKSVDERRPDDALATLDPLLESSPPELVAEIQMIRARALALKGENEEALSLLERHGPFSDPVVQRLQGVLLAAAGRGEEAEAILESLPLKFFNVEAFDGLIAALEQQRKWEKLIARLNTLGGEIPVRYRPTRMRAVVGAAERRMENLDPQGAIDFLRGNLDEEEVLSGSAGTLLVRALLETGQVDRALEILIDEGGGIEAVPAHLVSMVANKAADRLAPEQRFQLLRRVPDWERDDPTRKFLDENWPRFGSYLPRPGRYEATYKVRTFGPEGEVLTDVMETKKLVWKKSYFAVTGEDGTETWRTNGDTWVRTTNDYEWWLPVRVEDRSSLPKLESPDGVSAELVEFGHSVQCGTLTHAGCIGMEVKLPNLPSNESLRIDVAPEMGEIRWQRFQGRVKVEEGLLIGLIRTDEE